MKNPLHYQISEYDCGPTTVLNAVSYLFEREEIPAEVIRNIMLYSLDCYSPEGKPGGNGTSRAAMKFLSNWLNEFGKCGDHLPVTSRYLARENVFLGEGSPINDALVRGGVAVVRLYYDEWHYVLLDGIEEGRIRMFDPYYRDIPFTPDLTSEDVAVDLTHPFSWNRLVPEQCFNTEGTGLYSLGPLKSREAVLLFNSRTMRQAEETIEYYI